ncbi:uncharacterized protein P884DRAFT_264107 [Thermothelomyces heterothallicus CBS 202.75]|uniref:uncharacterized protein n=1 Tax=Thermothelomyces heterothallicus CBS 202.75 TaxID=1149848 RepID=UPI003743C310
MPDSGRQSEPRVPKPLRPRYAAQGRNWMPDSGRQSEPRAPKPLRSRCAAQGRRWIGRLHQEGIQSARSSSRPAWCRDRSSAASVSS